MANKPRLVRGIISELNVYGADTPVVYCVSPDLETSNTINVTHSPGWLLQKEGKEYVYGYRTTKNPDIVVYVYSTITNDGLGRKCGADAIRICLVNTTTNRGIGKSKRVNRTIGWDDRVKERVLELLKTVW